MVLYRKYRPQKFADVVGQEHIKQTLINALVGKSFSHGYLFAGPRGSGKTSLARILAKALNCTGRKISKGSFEPCNRCVSCQEISGGRSLDVIEIDAASNRGIDEMRELREKIRFAPTRSTFKVYIIDEVHMLTKEAFNALLKTLEEPPAHAIFVMATTEPHKVLATILSRVQRFDFHKATIEEITFLLKKTVRLEKINIDDEALKLIAQMSFGAFRDALSLLDQVTSTQAGTAKITLEKVQELLGLAQEESIFEFISYLAENNRKALFTLISKLFFQGVELENFTVGLIEILRKMALYKLNVEEIFDLTKEQQAKLKELSVNFDITTLMRLIEKLVASLPRIKSANMPQLPLEMVVFEFTSELQTTNLYKNTNKDKEETVVKSRGDAPNEVAVSRTKSETRLDREPENEGRPTALHNNKFDKNLWPEIVKEAKAHNNSISAMLKDAAISKVDGENITLAFKFKFHANVIANKKNTQIIEEIIETKTGMRYILACIVDPELVIKKPEDDETELLNGVSEVFEVEE